jgi:hypothetical protein
MLTQIKQHFQDWGNLYQVLVGIIFGIISVWLWFRDRNRSIQIKELADHTKYLSAQTDILKELLNESIVPKLRTKPRENNFPNGFIFKIINDGGALCDLSFHKLKNNTVKLILTDVNCISPGQELTIGYASNEGSNPEGILKDEVILTFKDRLNRNFQQKLIFRDIETYFEPIILLK